MRVNIAKLLIDLDNLVTTYVKPGYSSSLQYDTENIDESVIEPLISINEGIDTENINESVIEPLISINEGIKSHRKKDYENAWKCFDGQAKNGNRRGKYWKAYYLWEGFFVSKDKISAIKLFKEAADDGLSYAQLRYAFCLPDKDLKELNLDPKDSIKYLRLAAENGSDIAQYHMGDAYLWGKLDFKQDLEVAILWFRRSALQQNKNAIKKLQELNVELD